MKEKILEIITRKDIKFDTLKKLLNVSNEELNDILDELIADRMIYLNAEKKYCFLKPEYVVAILNSQYKGGKYVCDGKEKVFIPKEHLHTTLKHDLVVVERTYNNYGKVIGILKRENKKLVCEVREKNNQLHLALS